MVSYFKRFIFAGFIFCLSSLNYAFAGKNAGFIGFDLGGSAGAILSLNNGSSNIGTGITAGLRGGYQAFFNPRNGMRFYLAYAASFNAPSYAANPNAQLIDLERFGITHRADLNFDYLLPKSHHLYSAVWKLTLKLYILIAFSNSVCLILSSPEYDCNTLILLNIIYCGAFPSSQYFPIDLEGILK